MHSVTPLDTNHPPERLRAWSVPHQLKSIPSEDLGPGCEAPWLHWKCLNRLRTGMGRCKSNMLKWKYSDADTICDCAEQTQTIDHLLKCPMMPQECTTDDLLYGIMMDHTNLPIIIFFSNKTAEIIVFTTHIPFHTGFNFFELPNTPAFIFFNTTCRKL